MEQVRGITQAYLNTPWRKQLRMVMLFALIVVFWALVAGIYVDLRQRTATAGREILWMRARMETMDQRIADLQTELGILTSSRVMEERARRLGYQPVDKDEVIYLMVPGYVPPDDVVLAPPPETVKLVPAAPPADYTESLFSWARRQIRPYWEQLQETQP